jgi:mannose-6-phosphate isomerase-like protein (cupin superfamily)
MMKISLKDFPKKVKPIRKNEIYSVHDLDFLKHLTVAMTIEHPNKATTGHRHSNKEEVYIFLEGTGKMKLGERKFPVKKGDVVLVPGGRFHRVFNTGHKDLVFLCVFEKYKGRGK